MLGGGIKSFPEEHLKHFKASNGSNPRKRAVNKCQNIIFWNKWMSYSQLVEVYLSFW